MLGEHEASGDEPTAGLQQAPEQCGGDGERWVGDDVERAAGQAQVRGVCFHHDDGWSELGAQVLGPGMVGLHSDDPGAGADQRPGDGAEAGPDVEDEGASREIGVSDEAVGCGLVELMPAPPPRRRHGGAP